MLFKRTWEIKHGVQAMYKYIEIFQVHKQEMQTTHRANEAIRSAFEKLMPALHLVKLLALLSNDTSVPSDNTLLPSTAAKLTTGFAVNPTLVLIPA